MPRALVLALVFLTLPLFATTFAPVRDEDLADDARAVVVGRVVGVERDASITRYQIATERIVRGDVARELTLRVPGGTELIVHGAPRFEPGERALLFLVGNADGTFSPLHLMLGALTDGDSRGRDLDRFVTWLADREAGRIRPADYWSPRRVAPHFALFMAEGKHIRWFEFQRGATVLWHIDERQELARAAVAAWNDDHSSLVALGVASGAKQTGLGKRDGRNSILFGDPHDEVPGTYNCPRGGAIAMTAEWVGTTSAAHAGEEMAAIVEADIVFNDGVDCAATSTLEEAMGHELGHALGLAHACGGAWVCVDAAENEALMRAAAHLDGRGARIDVDDQFALRSLYTREGPLLGWTAVANAMSVRFTPTAGPAGVEYAWDFGDGSPLSHERAPAHEYAKAGTYVVRLRATDETGTSEVAQEVGVAASKQRSVRRV